ncbi:hypothetical protein HY734_03150 [Candidatus Uhrbacteria bacterium]|nr:hypothetical protein [Candidatus Uhrbacteria bacterium]
MRTDRRGAALLVGVVLFTALLLLLSGGMALGAWQALETGLAARGSGHLMLAAESCAEEAMTQLTRDAAYAGETMEVGPASCTISVAGVPCGSCTIRVEAAEGSWVRRLEVDATVDASTIVITRWEETP